MYTLWTSLENLNSGRRCKSLLQLRSSISVPGRKKGCYLTLDTWISLSVLACTQRYWLANPAVFISFFCCVKSCWSCWWQLDCRYISSVLRTFQATPLGTAFHAVHTEDLTAEKVTSNMASDSILLYATSVLSMGVVNPFDGETPFALCPFGDILPEESSKQR